MMKEENFNNALTSVNVTEKEFRNDSDVKRVRIISTVKTMITFVVW